MDQGRPVVKQRNTHFAADESDPSAMPADELNLTPRELEILQWLVEGFSDKKTTVTLFMSPLTVQSRITKVNEMLLVHSTSAAVSNALKYKLFE